MAILLAVRFLAELGMLAAFAWGGWWLTEQSAWSVVLAVLLPLAAAAVWGRWVAPKSAHRLPDPARLGVEVTLFGLALATVAGAHPRPEGLVFGLAVLLAYLVSMPSRRVAV